MSDSLQPCGLQHTRLPCPSPIPGACSNSCPLFVMPSNHLILCHRFLLLLSIFPNIRVFSNKWILHIRWPHYLSFSFRISASNEYMNKWNKVSYFMMLIRTPKPTTVKKKTHFRPIPLCIALIIHMLVNQIYSKSNLQSPSGISVMQKWFNT